MNNLNPQEIAKFNALASRWWDENSEFRPLHRINPHRLAWINQLNHPNQYEMIKALFCRKLYLLATGETVFSLDNGAVQEKVAKECGFTTEEIERWCLNPKKNIIRNKISKIRISS